MKMVLLKVARWRATVPKICLYICIYDSTNMNVFASFTISKEICNEICKVKETRNAATCRDSVI